MTSHHYSLALLCSIIGISFVGEFFVQAIIPIGPDSLSGMPYDEEFNIKKIKPKKPIRKTIGSYRLPRHVVPVHYYLEIRPILEGPIEEINTAPGRVAIRVLTKEPTNHITVHAKSLWIDNHALDVLSEVGVPKVNVTGHNFDEERSFYTIFLDGDLVVGEHYTVKINFRAKMPHSSELLAGVYRTTFMGSDGTMKTGSVTQFQKDDASRAFPCFDEPQLKAEFSIKVGRLQQYQTFCNMPRLGDPEPIDGHDGWVWDSYERTLKFAVYLIAFAVLPDYVYEETPKDLYRIPVKTWVPKSEKTSTSLKFSAAASGKILTHFEELFQIPFMLNKMDNLALPNIDLLAMEHPGLVTYRTNLLVWHKGRDTQWELFNGAQLIAHEYAHQWFGNLVTCKWWNDFWLNEAFARYYQFIGADVTGVNFRAKDRFVIDVVQWAMGFDESPETVSISNDETDKVFYQPFHIEYEKGASIVRMMQSILTQETFIKGLRKYFKKYAYSSTSQDDLFQIFTEQAREDGILRRNTTIGELMKPWFKKTGFPILQVSRGDSDSLYISQQRFILHPTANDKIEPGLWDVPIWFLTKSSGQIDMNEFPPNIWIDKDTLTTYLVLDSSQIEDWVIINPEARGYYRVVYDKTMLNLIVKQLEENHLAFNFATRSQLFDDHFRSAHARYISIQLALSLTSYLQKEDDLVVWVSVLNNFRKLYQRLSDTSIVSVFKKFVQSLIKPPLLRLGLYLDENAAPSDIMLHALFLEWLCTLEDPLCGKVVKGYMQEWIAKPDTFPVPVDLTSIVYCAAVANAEDDRTIKFLLKKYKKIKNNRHRTIIARALTCDKSEENLKSLVADAIDRDCERINSTDHGLTVLINVVKNPNGRKVIWEAIKSRATNITKILGPVAIPHVIDSAVPYLSNQGKSKLNYEIVGFIQRYMRVYGKHNKKVYDILQKSAQVVVDNSLWMDYFYDDVESWLNQKFNITKNKGHEHAREDEEETTIANL